MKKLCQNNLNSQIQSKIWVKKRNHKLKAIDMLLIWNHNKFDQKK